MKAKYALYILLLGIVLHILGAWLKITHFGNGNLVLSIAFILEIAGILLFIFKLLKNPAFKDFLNK